MIWVENFSSEQSEKNPGKEVLFQVSITSDEHTVLTVLQIFEEKKIRLKDEKGEMQI